MKTLIGLSGSTRFFGRARGRSPGGDGGWQYGTAGGTALGAAVKLGFNVTDRLGVGITTQTPFFVAFAPLRVPYAYPFTAGSVAYPAGLYVPVLVGGGVEYAVARNLLLTADTRMGPTLVTATSTAMFTLQAKAGVAWRM